MKLAAAALCAMLALFCAAFVTPASAKQYKPKPQKAVKLAKRYLGVPYVWGASGPSSFDCSGFTRFVLGKLGFHLPHKASLQETMGRRVSLSRLKPGDLVFFYNGGHVGLYVGGGKMIHASSSYGKVVVANVRRGWYRRQLDTARRFLR